MQAVGISLSETSSVAASFVYFKQHKPKKGDDLEADLADRMLFASNIPFHYNEQDVTELFASLGCTVEAVIFLGDPVPKHPVSRSARLVIESPEEVAQVLALDLTGVRQPFSQGHVQVGLERWLHRHSRALPDLSRLEDQVDKFMEAFDERAEKERKALRKNEEPDDDGWITVKSDKPKHRDLKTQEELDERNKKKKQKTGQKPILVNFYKNQQRNKKKQELMNLRMGFEADKARIQAMRANRRFNPY